MKKTVCSVDGCLADRRSKGYCQKHWHRVRRHGSIELPVAEWKKLREVGKARCSRCELVKSTDLFYKATTKSTGVSAYCKECDCKANKERYVAKKPTFVERRLKTRFGINTADYNKLLESQDGVCAICGNMESLKNRENLSVDHDHHTGKIRGLLCSKCNLGLGHFNDNKELVEAALKYLVEKGEQ